MCLRATFCIFQKFQLVLLDYVIERVPSAISNICLILIQLMKLLQNYFFWCVSYWQLSELNLLLISQGSICASPREIVGAYFRTGTACFNDRKSLHQFSHCTKPQSQSIYLQPMQHSAFLDQLLSFYCLTLLVWYILLVWYQQPGNILQSWK